MSKETKPQVDKEQTFDMLEIRLGKIISIEDAVDVPKKAYVIKVDFGKFGIRQTVGRFTQHAADELMHKHVLGVLNFGSREIGSYTSDFLLIGVQYPKADSGEATIITPLATDTKIGGKLF